MFLKETQLVKEAKKSRYLFNVFLTLLFALIFLFVGQMLGALISGTLRLSELLTSPINKMLLRLILGFLPITLLIFAFVKFIEKRNVSSMGFYKNGFVRKYFKGFMVGVAAFSSVVLLLAVTGHIKLVEVFNADKIIIFLMILPGWMIQGATEEILARGWLMNVLGAKYNITVGLILSSLFFGVLHGGNPNVSYVAIINLVITGIFFGLYVIKTEDLWGACGIHAAWNAFQGNFFGFEVSGMDTGVGSIMKLKSVGSDSFTGGAFGPEAGIACTIVISLISIFLIYRIRKSYKKATV